MAAPTGGIGGLSSLGATEALSVAEALSLPAESYGNDPNVEMVWAMKAYQHAEVYFNLISSVDPRLLKLTRTDDVIYTAFRGEFPALRIDVLDPEELKSAAAKEKWRPFCMQFENQVEDFNYGTLLRLDSSKEYSEENTIFCSSSLYNLESLEQIAVIGLDPDLRYASCICNSDKMKALRMHMDRLLDPTRIQFYAIEIARNREGYNDVIFHQKQTEPDK